MNDLEDEWYEAYSNDGFSPRLQEVENRPAAFNRLAVE
jgi:hypothetical protein